MDIQYLCDREACEKCVYPLCAHTDDISHAVSFMPTFDIIRKQEGYIEKEYDLLGLTPNEYQEKALYYERGMLNPGCKDNRLANGLMGLNGEAGEAIDILKKHWYQGHELDKEHLAKELGDVLWYIALSADAIGYSLSDIMEMNLDKLEARYPEGFDVEKSVHRAEGDI